MATCERVDQPSEVSDFCTTFRQNLTEQVTDLRQTIQSEHAEMAAHLREQQAEFIDNLTQSVNDLREQCQAEQQQRQQDFAEMAHRERTARNEFVTELQTNIADTLTDLNQDRAEANRIWFEMRTASIYDSSDAMPDGFDMAPEPLIAKPFQPAQTVIKQASTIVKKTKTTQQEIVRDSETFVSTLKSTMSSIVRERGKDKVEPENAKAEDHTHDDKKMSDDTHD